jgi:hypothetical protein
MWRRPKRIQAVIMDAGMVTQLNNAVSWNGRRMQNPQTMA